MCDEINCNRDPEGVPTGFSTIASSYSLNSGCEYWHDLDRLVRASPLNWFFLFFLNALRCWSCLPRLCLLLSANAIKLKMPTILSSLSRCCCLHSTGCKSLKCITELFPGRVYVFSFMYIWTNSSCVNVMFYVWVAWRNDSLLFYYAIFNG